MILVGAGLAGLVAAHAWPQATVVEAQPEPLQRHTALLRFRSDAVAKLTGIEFHSVQVRKGIWSEGRFIQPNIRLANLYSNKCLGSIAAERSIWNLDPVTRYIAPEDLYSQMIESVGRRIAWGTKADFPSSNSEPIVSTAPLPLTAAACGITHTLTFKRSPIFVQRFRLPRVSVHQTIYFPDPETTLYRASITGSLLILEHAAAAVDYPAPCDTDTLDLAMEAFGLRLDSVEALPSARQEYGKILPVNDSLRKGILFRLTHDHRIYSLGRFATWKNLLLDDVVDDIAVIKRLMRSGLHYDQARSYATT